MKYCVTINKEQIAVVYAFMSSSLITMKFEPFERIRRFHRPTKALAARVATSAPAAMRSSIDDGMLTAGEEVVSPDISFSRGDRQQALWSMCNPASLPFFMPVPGNGNSAWQ